MGQVVAGDAASYRYLVESIRQFPSKVLADMLAWPGLYKSVCVTCQLALPVFILAGNRLMRHLYCWRCFGSRQLHGIWGELGLGHLALVRLLPAWLRHNTTF